MAARGGNLFFVDVEVMQVQETWLCVIGERGDLVGNCIFGEEAARYIRTYVCVEAVL